MIAEKHNLFSFHLTMMSCVLWLESGPEDMRASTQ